MSLTVTSKVLLISIILFIFSSIFILVVEYFFPFSYVNTNENTYFYNTLLVHFLLLFSFFLIFNNKINRDLKINYKIDNKFLILFQILSLAGLFLFLIAKLSLMLPQNNFNILDSTSSMPPMPLPTNVCPGGGGSSGRCSNSGNDPNICSQKKCGYPEDCKGTGFPNCNVPWQSCPK